MDVLAPLVRFEPFPGGGGLPQLLAPLQDQPLTLMMLLSSLLPMLPWITIR